MKNLISVIFLILSFQLNAQTGCYKTPEQYPNEFSKLSYEYLQWDNANASVTLYNYSEIDSYVLSIIKTTKTQDMGYLVSILTKTSSNDLEKVRSIYIWLVNSMKYSVSIRDSFPTSVRSSESRDDDALFCFNKRKGACVEISSIFYLMCKKANIRAFLIGGFVKSYNTSKNEYEYAGHAWNAFKYNNTYYFLDATFGLQTKQNNDVMKNVNFVINSELYKYLYTPFDIYCSLSYKYENMVYTQEKDWVLKSLEYETSARLKNSDWEEFTTLRIMVEKTYFIKEVDWIKFPLFGYENYNLYIIKKWAAKYKIPTQVEKCPIDTFYLLKEKEYKKLKTNDRIAYNKAAEQYYPYWINYYKIMVDNNKHSQQYDLYFKEMKNLEYQFAYYKIFKK